MIGQNSFSQPNINSNPNDAVFTSGAAPAMNPVGAPSARKNSKKLPLIIGVAVLVIGLGVGAYFLFFRPKSEGTPVQVLTADSVTTGKESEEATLKDLDKTLAESKDAAEKLDNTLNKVRYLIMLEDYETALSELETLSDAGLSDYDLYRLYGHYSTVYNGLGDTAKANRYKKLADEAHSRDFDAYATEN